MANIAQIVIALATLGLVIVAILGLRKAEKIIQNQKQIQNQGQGQVQGQNVAQSLNANSSDLIKVIQCKATVVHEPVDVALVFEKESFNLLHVHCSFLDGNNLCTNLGSKPPCKLALGIGNKAR